MKKTITGQFTGLLLQHAGRRNCFRSWSFMTDHGPGILVSGPGFIIRTGPAFIAFDRRDYYSIPAGTGCNIPITRAGTVAPVLHAGPIAPAADHVTGAGAAGARGAVPDIEEPLKGALKLCQKFLSKRIDKNFWN